MLTIALDPRDLAAIGIVAERRMEFGEVLIQPPEVTWGKPRRKNTNQPDGAWNLCGSIFESPVTAGSEM